MKYEPRRPTPLSDTEILMQPFMHQYEADLQNNWEMLEAVQECMDKLSKKDQEILRLVFFDRLTYEQLAESINTKAKSHALRQTQAALKRLELELHKNLKFIRSFNLNKPTTWNDGADMAVRAIFARTNGRIKYRPNYQYAQTLISSWVRQEGITQDGAVDAMLMAGVEAMMELMESTDERIIEDTLIDILVRKQNDYGHDNINYFGLVGVGVRLCDKIARMYNLLDKQEDPLNESYLDTLVDIVGYAAIAYMLEAGTFQLELEEANATR